MEMNTQKIIVIGCARSGLGAAKLANNYGNEVTLYDKKERSSFDLTVQQEMNDLEAQGIQMAFQADIELSTYDLIIVSPGVPLDLPFIQAAYERGQQIVGEFEYASTFCKSPIIGITGTNGKTTTTSLVGEIIASYNPDTFVVGNIGRAFSEEVEKIPPSGATVAEVSSFQLETTQTFHPCIAAILNITPDHLNRHKTMENYVQAKMDVTKNQTEKDFLIVNKNDPYYKQIIAYTKAKVVVFDGVLPVEYGVYQEESVLYEKMTGEAKRICDVTELKIVGRHNVENALAAIAICKAYGIPNHKIREGLLKFAGVEHRVEYVTTKKGVDYYNDSKATNTDAAITGILSMSKPIRLLAGGMDKKVSFKDWVKLFDGRVEKVYVIGECKTQIIRECEEVGFYAIEAYKSFEEAIDCAVEDARVGECVLLSPACASWDMFESYEQRGDIFKDRIVKMEG